MTHGFAAHSRVTSRTVCASLRIAPAAYNTLSACYQMLRDIWRAVVARVFSPPRHAITLSLAGHSLARHGDRHHQRGTAARVSPLASQQRRYSRSASLINGVIRRRRNAMARLAATRYTAHIFGIDAALLAASSLPSPRRAGALISTRSHRYYSRSVAS